MSLARGRHGRALDQQLAVDLLLSEVTMNVDLGTLTPGNRVLALKQLQACER